MATASAWSRTRDWPALGRYLVPALIVGLFALALVRFHIYRGELPVYQVGAERMLAGEGVYLRSGDPIAHTPPFTYPPFFALVFVPLTWLPEAWQSTAWAFVFCTAMVGVFALLARIVEPEFAGHQDTPTRYLFWGLLALLTGRHVLSILEAQSHDVLVLLLVMWTVDEICRGRYALGGLGAGLAAACKATPLFFAPVFLWQRRWRAAACVVVAATAATCLPDVLTPSRDRTSWAAIWYHTFLTKVQPGEAVDEAGSWPKWSEANQSLSGTWYRLLNPPQVQPGREERDVSFWHASPMTTKFVTLASQLAVLVLVLWATWPRRAVESWPENEARCYRFGQCAVIVTAMPLLSPMSSKSHFGVLLLPVAYVLAEYLYRRRDPIVVGLLVAVFVIGTLTVKGLLGHTAGRYVLGLGPVTWCALACLLAAARTLYLRHGLLGQPAR